MDIALHNATEGCVTETWAALLARYQSEHAADPAARAAYATIADDEARHAQLAWELHAWLCAGIDAAALALALPSDVRLSLGLPDARQARALAEDFGIRLAAVA